MRATRGDGHPFFVSFATPATIKCKVAANAGDALQQVRNIASDPDGRKKSPGALAVDDLLAIVSSDLHTPAQRVFHAAARLAEIDAMLQTGEQIGWRCGAWPKERVGHARVAFARVAFAS